MMYKFLLSNRDELAARCRAKVALRPGRSATSEQLRNGVPMFLDQLIRTLQIERSQNPMDSRRISGPSNGGLALSEVGASAALHGKDLLGLGFSVDQVVHDYGDLCQAITDLAIELDVQFQVDEFQTLNRCLDNAIADAVTEFSYQRDFVSADKHVSASNMRLNIVANELRDILGTVSLAFSAVKTGNLSLTGATGTILERGIEKIGKLIDGSMVDIREMVTDTSIFTSFSLSELIAEVKSSAEAAAQEAGCVFTVPSVDATLAIRGNREQLFLAVAHLLRNAFKLTRAGTEVTLSAYASSDRIIIDVMDHRGGPPPDAAETTSPPFSQSGEGRNGAGLDPVAYRQGIMENGGTLTFHKVPGMACIFTVNLPRYETPS